MLEETKIKIIVLGSAGVGKTSLLNACVNKGENTYRPFENASTMNVILREHDNEYSMELWDTKSVDYYKIIEEMQNDSCFSIALICYSVIELKSFQDVKKRVSM